MVELTEESKARVARARAYNNSDVREQYSAQRIPNDGICLSAEITNGVKKAVESGYAERVGKALKMD